MSKKSYLPTILIFAAAILLSCFSVKAQSLSDTIRVEKRGLRYIYYKDNVMINFQQVMYLTASNPKAFRLLKESKNMRNAGYFFAIIGGGCVGYSLGYMLGRSISDNTINYGLFAAILAAGTVSIGVGIGFQIQASNKAKNAVVVFNNAIKRKNKANLDLSFSPGGVLLRLNF